ILVSDWSSDVCSSDLHQAPSRSALELTNPAAEGPWPKRAPIAFRFARPGCRTASTSDAGILLDRRATIRRAEGALRRTISRRVEIGRAALGKEGRCSE